MGMLSAVIVLCIGLVLAYVLMKVPEKYIPICWVANCADYKMYFLVIVLSLCLLIIPV